VHYAFLRTFFLKKCIEIVRLLVPKMSKIGICRLDANRNSAHAIALQRRKEEGMKEIRELIVEYM
jgi:hypothetical protein